MLNEVQLHKHFIAQVYFHIDHLKEQLMKLLLYKLKKPDEEQLLRTYREEMIALWQPIDLSLLSVQGTFPRDLLLS